MTLTLLSPWTILLDSIKVLQLNPTKMYLLVNSRSVTMADNLTQLTRNYALATWVQKGEVPCFRVLSPSVNWLCLMGTSPILGRGKNSSLWNYETKHSGEFWNDGASAMIFECVVCSFFINVKVVFFIDTVTLRRTNKSLMQLSSAF